MSGPRKLLWMLTVRDFQCSYDKMPKRKRQHLCPAISLKLRATECLLRVIPTWVKQLWKEIVDYKSVKARVCRQRWPFLKQQWQLQIAFSLQSHSLSSASRCINHPNPGTRRNSLPMTLVHLWPSFIIHLEENTNCLSLRSTNNIFLCAIGIMYPGKIKQLF